MIAMRESRPWSRLGRAGARLRPGAGGLLAWWTTSLAAWLPLRWRQALGIDRGRLLLQVDGDALQLRVQQGADVRDLGHAPGVLVVPGSSDPDASALDAITLDAAQLRGGAAGDPLLRLLAPGAADLPRWLLLPAATSLRRRLPLPAAARERLRDVVGFEIERQTPFAPDAVAFDARVLGRHGADGPLDVELVVVPDSVIAPLRAALGPIAGTLAGIDVAGPDGAPLGVNLLPMALRRGRVDAWRVWNLALFAVALMATAALLVQWLDNRRDAADGVRARIAAKADAGRRAAVERQQLVHLIEGQAFLDEARAAQPTTIEVLDELTRRLPDTTYLEKVSIEGERLMLIGLSREAATLPERLKDATLWRNPALAGALQPDPTSGRDRFTLTADLAPTRPAPRAGRTGGANAGG